MRTTHKNGKFLHVPNTKDYLRSLGSMLRWSNILYEHTQEPYKEFLQGLIQKEFYRDVTERIILKDVAKSFNIDVQKASKWLKKMYDDLTELNYEHPDLFKTARTRHDLSYQYFDSYGSCTIFLEQTPAMYDTFIFPFAHAAVGTERFYVNSVEHYYDGTEQCISVDLIGGFVNRYRELLVDRAIYHGVISRMAKYDMADFEIDKEITAFYKY